MNYQRKYYPRHPVKSFQDLEVYQKTLGLAVEITKRIRKDGGINCDKLLACVSNLPVLIATAHSVRFGNSGRAIESLEEAMLACNLAVVYLEQYRDLENKKIKHDYFEEQIKEYLGVRGKIMRLQKSWIKFMQPQERKYAR